MEKKVLLIVNPKAGKGTIEKRLPKILKNFSRQGHDIVLFHTRKDYKPKDILEDYKDEKIDLLICCGGDGTLNEVINAIMKSGRKIDISFIPLGTMNDFARTIKMSTNRFFLSKNIKNSKKVVSDIGKFNKRYFNYVAAFGAFTQVPYVTRQGLKRTFGKLAYFMVAFKYLRRIETYKMNLEVNKTKVSGEFIFGSISNTKYIGSIEWFKKGDVKINDGKFEMIFVRKPKNFFQLIDMSLALTFKQFKRKYFSYFQSEEIIINSDKKIMWTLDGEYGGRHKEVKITNNKKQITYIVPQ